MSRQRFVDEIKDLNAEQLHWKPYDNTLSIGQMAIHVAGVEILFTSGLQKRELNPAEAKIAAAAADSVVNDKPFPFSNEEITPESVAEALQTAKTILEPIITNPTEADLAGEVKSVLGPMISGQGVLIRMAFHSAYHQGQAYTYKMSPGFPGS